MVSLDYSNTKLFSDVFLQLRFLHHHNDSPLTQSAGNPEDDISPILGRWIFSDGIPRVRFLDGIGENRRIQIRLEAGIMQFELIGRPDGKRPEGSESWLEFWGASEEKLAQVECEILRAEVHLYHQRAAAYLMLEDFVSVIRDCDRNLFAIDFVWRRAIRGADLESFDAIRIATVLLRTRAEASMCIRIRDTQGALKAIDRGLANLHGGAGSSRRMPEEDSSEALMLRSMRDALVPKLPSSQRVDLESRLKHALRMENYELAAILRNELRQIGY